MTRSSILRRGVVGPVVMVLVSILAAAPSVAATIEIPPQALFDKAALARAVRFVRIEQPAAANACECGASMAEKLAWLYLLVGGSILLAYGPQEKSGSAWSNDGKAETAAGAGAIVLSFGLLRDIRKKARTPAHP
jgi:hypothetical protein